MVQIQTARHAILTACEGQLDRLVFETLEVAPTEVLIFLTAFSNCPICFSGAAVRDSLS
jgi:hypothetical protein